MSKKKEIGTCRLCQKTKKLTFEHVPPKCAFNDDKVKMVNLKTMLENGTYSSVSDLDKQYGKILQQGRGGYFLCADCNSKTGQWYASEYNQFIKGVAYVLSEIKDSPVECVHINFKKTNPLALFKEALTMFCDINEGLSADDNIKKYLLDKESTEFNTEKYRIYIHIHRGKMFRQNGFSIMVRTDGTVINLSEITAFPIGLTLYKELPVGYKPKGVDITGFVKCDYNKEYDLNIDIPILESNSIFSGDYRTEEEIEEQAKKNS